MNLLGRRARAALSALMVVGLLAGCGSGDDDNSPQVRLINASPDYASLNLTWADTTIASSVALGNASAYTSVSSGTSATTLTTTSSATSLLSADRTVADSTSYTVVAYGWSSGLKSAILTENEATPSSGYAKFRIFNTATDAGSLDVYLTSESTSLDSSTPVASSVSGGSFNSAGYLSVTPGTWRLRATSASSTTDVRLDLSSLTLSNQGIYTLILVPTKGGVMVNSIMMQQASTVTATNTTMARARLVAAVGATTTPTVSAIVSGTTLSSGTSSPSVGSYVTVTAGTARSLDVKVNGSTLGTATLDIDAGAELTLLVAGDASAPTLTVLSDDNRLPTTSYAKVRLVHGSYGTGNLFLDLDYAALASDVSYGQASSYSTVAATGTTTSVLDVSSASGKLFSVSDLNLQSKGIYTAFLLGLSTAPQGVLRKDR